MKTAAEILVTAALLTIAISFIFTAATFALIPLLNRKAAPVAPGARRNWLRAFLFEFYSQTFFIFSYVTQLRGIAFRMKGKGRPIILVPGFVSPGGAMYVLGRRLNTASGRPVLALSHRPSMFSSIQRLADRLGEIVEKETAGSSDRTVDLVGHSMGGLISRYYVEKLGGARRVRKVVMMGTPHEGARLAKVAFGACAREMEPGSEFLSELGPPPNEVIYFIEYASFGSLFDNIVQPTGSADPTGGKAVNGALLSHQWFGDTGHVGLVFHPGVASEIQRLLGND